MAQHGPALKIEIAEFVFPVLTASIHSRDCGQKSEKVRKNSICKLSTNYSFFTNIDFEIGKNFLNSTILSSEKSNGSR